MSNVTNIIELKNSKYNNCVIIQTHRSLQEVKKELDENLSIAVTNGSILIDTLFHAGNTEGRFIEAVINDGGVNWSSLKPVRIDKRDEIRVVVAKEIGKNFDLLNHSTLTSIQKNLISKGVGI